jgi:hypothetical protein
MFNELHNVFVHLLVSNVAIVIFFFQKLKNNLGKKLSAVLSL